jgi:cytochrome c oxidase subunit 2
MAVDAQLMRQTGAGAFDPQGPVAGAIEGLWWLMLGLGTVVFVVFAVLLVVGLFRRRAAAEPEPGHAPAIFDRWLVVAGVVAPFIIIVVVLVASTQAMRWVPTSAPRDAMVVEMVAHQWWWEVRYPDQQVTARNELHIPVGQRVNLQLTSADVIHSFWVPELAGKMDALPDGVNTLVLEADQPGEHQSLCAEFCGLEHANMRLRVFAEPTDQFESWIADQEARQ